MLSRAVCKLDMRYDLMSLVNYRQLAVCVQILNICQVLSLVFACVLFMPCGDGSMRVYVCA